MSQWWRNIAMISIQLFHLCNLHFVPISMVKTINKQVNYVSTCEFQVDIVFFSQLQAVLMKIYVGSNTTRAHGEVMYNIL